MFPLVFAVESETDTAEPPNVPAAEANEAAILAELGGNDPAARSRLLAMLHMPGTMMGATSSAKLSDQLSRYYAAHRRAIRERQRQASLDAANGRGVRVILVLATPTKGSVASIRPSYSVDPVDIVVLGPEATAGVLSEALVSIERVRARDGYRPNFTHEGELVGLGYPTRSAAREREMETLLQQLRAAPARTIEGIGTVPAIDLHTASLSPPNAP